jgi:signal transduction histidine kinase
MDAVGQLAGGIAHDFNNLMLAVLVNAEFAMQELASEHEDVRAHLQEIERAGQRAAALTQQLLAFSRWAPLSAEPVELNGLVRNLIKMLRRLIPESIEVGLRPF